jgi:hypothetical protein
MKGDVVAHDTKVDWVDEDVELTDVQLADWTCRTETFADDTWTQHAKGPCPNCGEIVEGSISSADISVGVAFEPTKVPIDCNCGYKHGHDGANGCGRSWAVTCPVIVEEPPNV